LSADLGLGSIRMITRRNFRGRSILAGLVALTLPVVALAQLTVITSGGFFAAYQELLPIFKKDSGIAVATRRGPSQGSGPDTIAAQLRRGVPVNVVIMSRTRRARDDEAARHQIVW
jgi:molybdate transport system substrate-binding protein